MVYDDYADIGIFAKWVMDAPEIGERLLFLRLQFLPKNISAYSMGGTTKQKGTICFVRKLAVRNEAMRKIS